MVAALGLNQHVMWLALCLSVLIPIAVLGLFAVARSSQISRAEEKREAHE